jgi:hypothetical protein
VVEASEADLQRRGLKRRTSLKAIKDKDDYVALRHWSAFRACSRCHERTSTSIILTRNVMICSVLIILIIPREPQPEIKPRTPVIGGNTANSRTA